MEDLGYFFGQFLLWRDFIIIPAVVIMSHLWNDSRVWMVIWMAMMSGKGTHWAWNRFLDYLGDNPSVKEEAEWVEEEEEELVVDEKEEAESGYYEIEIGGEESMDWTEAFRDIFMTEVERSRKGYQRPMDLVITIWSGESLWAVEKTCVLIKWIIQYRKLGGWISVGLNDHGKLWGPGLWLFLVADHVTIGDQVLLGTIDHEEVLKSEGVVDIFRQSKEMDSYMVERFDRVQIRDLDYWFFGKGTFGRGPTEISAIRVVELIGKQITVNVEENTGWEGSDSDDSDWESESDD